MYSFQDHFAGSGKTFTYNYIISKLLSMAIACATAARAGIASTLLNGGKTFHLMLGCHCMMQQLWSHYYYYCAPYRYTQLCKQLKVQQSQAQIQHSANTAGGEGFLFYKKFQTNALPTPATVAHFFTRKSRKQSVHAASSVSCVYLRQNLYFNYPKPCKMLANSFSSVYLTLLLFMEFCKTVIISQKTNYFKELPTVYRLKLVHLISFFNYVAA